MGNRLKMMAIIAVLLIISSPAQGANNIEHLWTDSTLSNTVAIATRGNYAYIADRDFGMVVMSLSNSLPPQFASSYDPGIPIYDIDVRGNYAFIAAGINESHNGWILIVDIESSINPVYVGAFITDEAVTKVAVGNYAFAYRSGLLEIADYSDPANPTEAGSLAVTNVADIFTRGNYVYLACQNLGLKIVDVSTPGSPQLIGVCDTPGIAPGVTMRTADSTHVYIADGPSGIQIIDVGEPNSPAIVGNFLTESEAVSITGGRLLVYATMIDSTVAAVLVGNPRFPKLAGATNIPHAPNGIALYGSGSDGGIAVADRNMLDIYGIHLTTCIRIPGDINGNGAANGIDVTYGISYFKGGNVPPQVCSCWTHPNGCLNCDVNASCQFNGVDLTYLVSYLSDRVAELLPCPDCPEDY